jgi:hypothetical protein
MASILSFCSHTASTLQATTREHNTTRTSPHYQEENPALVREENLSMFLRQFNRAISSNAGGQRSTLKHLTDAEVKQLHSIPTSLTMMMENEKTIANIRQKGWQGRFTSFSFVPAIALART